MLGDGAPIAREYMVQSIAHATCLMLERSVRKDVYLALWNSRRSFRILSNGTPNMFLWMRLKMYVESRKTVNIICLLGGVHARMATYFGRVKV